MNFLSIWLVQFKPQWKSIWNYLGLKVWCKSCKTQREAGTGLWSWDLIWYLRSGACGLLLILHLLKQTNKPLKGWSKMFNKRRFLENEFLISLAIAIAKFLCGMWINMFLPVWEALPDGLSGWWNQRRLKATNVPACFSMLFSSHSFFWFFQITELKK